MLNFKLKREDIKNSYEVIPYLNSSIQGDYYTFITKHEHLLESGVLIKIKCGDYSENARAIIPIGGINICGVFNDLLDFTTSTAFLNPTFGVIYYINSELLYYLFNGVTWTTHSYDDIYGIMENKHNIINIPKVDFYGLNVSNIIGTNIQRNRIVDVDGSRAIVFKLSGDHPFRSDLKGVKIKRNLESTTALDIDYRSLKKGDFMLFNNTFLYKCNSDNSDFPFDGPLNATCVVTIELGGKTVQYKAIIPKTMDGVDDATMLIVFVNDLNTYTNILLYKNELVLKYKNTLFMDEEGVIKPNIEIFRDNGFFSLKIPFSNPFGMDSLKDEIINDLFVSEVVENRVNGSLNLEKTKVLPSFIDSVFNENENYQTGKLKEVDKIELNLHFRERNNNTEWFIEERGYWNGYGLTNDRLKPLSQLYSGVDFQSDTLGWLGYTDDDVFYQKSKLKKSFIRLSFYDSKDPKTQKLIYYSTVFIDSGFLLGKYIKNLELPNYYDKMDNRLSESLYGGSVNSERVVFDESLRLSSRFVIENSNNLNKSSEGFYLYMFRDDFSKLNVKTIYMKVEFNHGGYGRTLPFTMPVVNSDWSPIPITSPNFPHNGYKVIRNGAENVDMTAYYNNLFIEIKCVYDSHANEYRYFLPRAASYNERNEKKIVLNLYETKI